MLLRDSRFLCAMGLTLCQQLLLALSTYCIASAGAALAKGNFDSVGVDISLFLGFALLAYVVSSAASLLNVRAVNRIWHRYIHTTLREATLSLEYASGNNQKAIAQWLGSEAQSTIAQACDFHLEMLSLCLNILFTLAVFYVALSWQVAAALAASLMVSLLIALLLRKRIEVSATAMQQQRLAALLALEPAWARALFGSPAMRAQGFAALDAKTQRYFGERNRYALLEQIVACGPIILCTLALMALLQFGDLFTSAMAGAMVALLPRSLQVFGNIHALSVYLSQFFLVRTRLHNLDAFVAGLERFRMHDISLQSIAIDGPQKAWLPDLLLRALQGKHLSCGRFTITGPNGAGKSTLLKIIKDTVDDSLLLTPETCFGDASSTLSTGQRRIQEIEHALATATPLVMLDEWDANLDPDNCMKIDQRLDEASTRMVIIEVRHSRK